MTTDAQCAPGNFHREHLISLNVVIDCSAIYIYDLRSTRDPYDFHILAAARAPHLVTEDARRLRLRSVHDATVKFGASLPPSLRKPVTPLPTLWAMWDCSKLSHFQNLAMAALYLPQRSTRNAPWLTVRSKSMLRFLYEFTHTYPCRAGRFLS